MKDVCLPGGGPQLLMPNLPGLQCDRRKVAVLGKTGRGGRVHFIHYLLLQNY